VHAMLRTKNWVLHFRWHIFASHQSVSRSSNQSINW